MNINMAFPWTKCHRDDGAYWEFCIIFASILQVAPETIFQERAVSTRRTVFSSTNNNKVIPKQLWRKGIWRRETKQELRRGRSVAPLCVRLQREINAKWGSSSIYAYYIRRTVFVCLQPPLSIYHNYLHHHPLHYHYYLYTKGLTAF